MMESRKVAQPKGTKMTLYTVTRQQVNCGPTQTISTYDVDEAGRAFDIAVSEDDQFVTLYNETEDFEVLRHLAPMKRSRYTDAGHEVVYS